MIEVTFDAHLPESLESFNADFNIMNFADQACQFALCHLTTCAVAAMGWGGWGKGKGYHHHHHPVERAVAEVAVLGGAALAGAAVASAVAAPRRPAPVVREVVVTPAPVAVAPVMGTPVAATPVVVYKGKGKGKGWKGKGKGVTEVLEVPPLGVSAVGIPASGLSKQQGVTFFSVDVVPEKGASYRLQKRYNDFDGLKDGGESGQMPSSKHSK